MKLVESPPLRRRSPAHTTRWQTRHLSIENNLIELNLPDDTYSDGIMPYGVALSSKTYSTLESILIPEGENLPAHMHRHVLIRDNVILHPNGGIETRVPALTHAIQIAATIGALVQDNIVSAKFSKTISQLGSKLTHYAGNSEASGRLIRGHNENHTADVEDVRDMIEMAMLL